MERTLSKQRSLSLVSWLLEKDSSKEHLTCKNFSRDDFDRYWEEGLLDPDKGAGIEYHCLECFGCLQKLELAQKLHEKAEKAARTISDEKLVNILQSRLKRCGPERL